MNTVGTLTTYQYFKPMLRQKPYFMDGFDYRVKKYIFSAVEKTALYLYYPNLKPIEKTSFLDFS